MVDFDTKTHTQKNYYYILGVRSDASPAEIQDAYRDLYHKFGPHVHTQGMDPDMLMKNFREINLAYEVLMNPEKRKEYDKNAPVTSQSQAELRNLWTKAAGVGEGEIAASSQADRYEIEVELTLREAMKGCAKVVKVSDLVPCTECLNFQPIHRKQCKNCQGTGNYELEREETVEIPAGNYEGAEFSVQGQGRYNPATGRKSDLVLNVKLLPHPFFTLVGRDVILNLPVTLFEAVLGAEIEVPTITGRVVMKIQPLSQSGRLYRLKGLGLAGADQLVTMEIQLPQQLSGEEVTLFHKLKSMSPEPNPREKFFQK